MTPMLGYYIEGCPIPFHDLIEISEFLSSLSVASLYLFSMSRVMFCSVPLFWLVVYDLNGQTYCSYKEYPRDRNFVALQGTGLKTP
jgi:hypothetical protein